MRATEAKKWLNSIANVSCSKDALDRNTALNRLSSLQEKYGSSIKGSVYPCPICSAWHITRKKGQKKNRLS